MENTMAYVCFYFDYLETLEPFQDAQLGRLLRAMLRYARFGSLPQFSGNERFIWPTLQAQIDRDQSVYRQRCEQNRINGKKGGRPRQVKETESSLVSDENVTKKTEGFSEKPKKPNNKENNKNKKNNKKSNKESNSNISQTSAAKPPSPARFIPPDIEQVSAYCRDMNYDIDPQRFVDYYSSIGWKVGKNPMKDWKAALRNWNSSQNRKEHNHGETELYENCSIGIVL